MKVTVPLLMLHPVLAASRVIAAVSPEVAVAAGVYVPPIAGLAGAVVVKLTVWSALAMVNGVAPELAKEALTLGAAKLPIRTKFIQRIGDA